MKIRAILFSIPLILWNTLQAQTRYFEFTTDCGHGNWQDTSFIAITNNPVVIAAVLEDLQKPMEERRFISGPIDHGNGGFNHNASHWFLWHFIPDRWELAEMAIEVCDGCPYSDVDADTAYWISNIGTFCPWSGKVSREILIPTGTEDNTSETSFYIYPNPVNDFAVFHDSSPGKTTSLTLYDLAGRNIRKFSVLSGERLSFTGINAGTYILRSDQQWNSSIVLIKIADNE